MAFNWKLFLSGSAAIIAGVATLYAVRPSENKKENETIEQIVEEPIKFTKNKDKTYTIKLPQNNYNQAEISYKLENEKALIQYNTLLNKIKEKYKLNRYLTNEEITQLVIQIDDPRNNRNIGTITQEEIQKAISKYRELNINITPPNITPPNLKESYDKVKKAAENAWETAKKKTDIARENYKQAWNAYKNSGYNSGFKLDERSRELENKYSEARNQERNKQRMKYQR